MAGLAAIILFLVWLFWKELLLTTFDPLFAKTSGFNVQRIEQLLIGLLICAIAIGLQTVGVVLMSSMIVAPAAAARQWTSSLRAMAKLSAFFGVCAAASGCIVSSLFNRIPTGPAVVIALSIIVLFSLLGAPHRGIVWNRVRT
jgi:manganese/zinc/iron transport system permease protein